MFNDIGTLEKQIPQDIGIILRPERFICFLITEDDFILITENNSYELIT